MKDPKTGLETPKVVILSQSSDGKFANIAVSVFNSLIKKEVITSFFGCEVLPDGKIRKDVSKRNIGVDYLYFQH